METNKKIYASLLKRDTKEKIVVVDKLIQANDGLVRLVHSLKIELDEALNNLDKMQMSLNSYKQEKHLVDENYRSAKHRITELEMLLEEKNKIIHGLMEEK